MSTTFEEIYQQSIQNPEKFWSEAAKEIDWIKPWDQTLDTSNPPHFQWFKGGKLNTCYNCVDRHVLAGKGEKTAILYDSAMTGQKRQITYKELQDHVSTFAGALAEKNVNHGDRVIIYMPMVPEAIIAALACARLGAIHSIVFGGFAAQELAVRINDCTPKVIVSASCGLEPGRIISYKPLLDEAINLSDHKPESCIILQRPELKAELIKDRDITWHQAIENATPHDCIAVDATDPLYILYTSGTTGQPKGIVRDNGGHAVALKWSMSNIYDTSPGDIYWAASDVGWVVGHSYIIYGPLLHGCTTVLYEGKPIGTPDAGAFWRVISQYNVKVMFTAPTAIRAIRQQDPEGKCLKSYNLGNLKALFLAGERSDPDTIIWLQEKLGIPVIDHWWQTETGWAIAANCLGIEQLPIVLGSAARACPTWDVRILDEESNEVQPGEIGAICVKAPLPPCAFSTLWNANERYRQVYYSKFPGFYETGDAGIKGENGYIHIMARTDDVINVAGHRLSTGAIEEVLASHQNIAECAVVGAADDIKGQVPFGFLVINAGCNEQAQTITQQCIDLVREKIGPVAAFKTATIVKRLPKTRSGKILRSTMKKIIDGQEYKMPATIEDASVLQEITEAISQIKPKKVEKPSIFQKLGKILAK